MLIASIIYFAAAPKLISNHFVFYRELFILSRYFAWKPIIHKTYLFNFLIKDRDWAVIYFIQHSNSENE